MPAISESERDSEREEKGEARPTGKDGQGRAISCCQINCDFRQVEKEASQGITTPVAAAGSSTLV